MNLFPFLIHVLDERTESIYFSISADAAPDVSHQEQNVLVLRYVLHNKETKTFEIKERSIEFLVLKFH